MILHSCEGTENADATRACGRAQALQQYADAGGRVFASHWHNYWFEHGPAPWPTVAQLRPPGRPADPVHGDDRHELPKGHAMANWLMNVGGSTTLGQLVIRGAQHTIDTVNGTASQLDLQRREPGGVAGHAAQPVDQYLTFNTPAGAAAMAVRARGAQRHPRLQCGHARRHVRHRPAFPTGCGQPICRRRRRRWSSCSSTSRRASSPTRGRRSRP